MNDLVDVASGIPEYLREQGLSRTALRARRKLIEATIECVKHEGSSGCSIRRIAERADVSIGVINYHYQSIQFLVADAYRHLAGDMLRAAVRAGEGHEQDPRRQISAYFEATFSDAVMDRAMLRAWLVFWGMIETSAAIRAAHDRTVGDSLAFVEGILARMDRQRPVHPTPRLAAIGLSAMIDGLWLEWCLQPQNFTRIEALRLCEAWVDAVWRPQP